jgi:hypothetical protein
MSSYDLLIPAGALDREWETGVVATAAREPEHEKIVRCVSCGAVILLGGFVDDVDLATYRGVFCCQVSHDDWEPSRIGGVSA